ncbi:putative integrase core domain protein [Rhizophagus irregularis DAOM 181602=DAOM 197198]|nr:putative integrase core domain protein [Rhizophagus irregularis DAOM 181602=DAOM 197198]
MEQVIRTTNSEIETLIKALRDVQKEIIALRDKNRELDNIITDDWNKKEVSSIKEIQEEIIKIEITISKIEIYKEILWKRVKGIVYRRKDEKRLRVIKRFEFEGLMYMMHDNELSGHFGMNTTYEKIRERYYWKNMRKDIEKYVRMCRNCQMRGRPIGRNELHPIRIGEPFEVIGIDIVGPLNETGKGNKYIVVAIDYFTKWVEARALREATANEVTEFLWEDIICRHGCPKKIISDRGTHFNNRMMEKLVERCGINHRLSTPYHPETNGLVERFNRTLCELLAKLGGQDWDRNIPSVLFAYRTKKHKSSNMQPFYVTYGREARIPLDKDENKMTMMERVKTLIEDLLKIRFKVKENLMKAQVKQKGYHDEKYKIKEEFEIGEKVLLYEAWREKQWSGKLQEKWKGPYVIHEKLLNGSYRLKELNG